MSDSIIHSEGLLAAEPARLIGAITTVLTSIVALAVVLGVKPELAAAIMGVLATVLPIVVGTIIRQRVYAPDTVQKLVSAGVMHGGALMRKSLSGDDGSGATLV